MTETPRSTINVLFLASSFVVGSFAVATCLLARTFFMYTPADWLTVDYTVTGWVLRLFSGVVGISALVLALFARRGIQKRIVRRFVYRTDVTIALIAIAFETAIPVILLVLIIGLIEDSVSRSVESQSIGCLGGGLDFFDFFDADE